LDQWLWEVKNINDNGVIFLEKLNASGPSSKVDEIIAVASALFSMKGYSATSLKEIADEVGLHKTSLFHYFKNKEEILMEVMDKGLREYVNILDESAIDPNLEIAEKLRVALEKQVSVICKYKDYINVGLNEIKSLSPGNREKYNTKRKQYGRRFEKIIQEIQGDNGAPLFKNLNFKIVNLGILGMCNWIINWYKEDGPLGPKEISEIFFGILTQKTDK
jgi:AcrR family transcriptional regulator